MAFFRFNALSVLLAAAVVVGVEGSFWYEPKNPNDPAKVSLVRQALTALGISADGITVSQFYQKWWGLGYSYKATYTDADGRTCFLRFQWQDFLGLRVPEMPQCDDSQPDPSGVDDCDLESEKCTWKDCEETPTPCYRKTKECGRCQQKGELFMSRISGRRGRLT